MIWLVRASLCRALVFLTVLTPNCAPAQGFGFRDDVDGVTCGYFDLALWIGWPDKQLAWIDADGRAGGNRPFDQNSVGQRMAGNPLEWDLTALVRSWLAGSAPADGVLLRVVGPALGGAAFHAREAANAAARPALRVELTDGSVRFLAALADSHLDCRSKEGLGGQVALRIGSDTPALLRFDLPRLEGVPAARVRSARLQLTPTGARPWGDAALGAFRFQAPWHQPLPAPPAGQAAQSAGLGGTSSAWQPWWWDSFEDDGLKPGWEQGEPSLARTVATAPDQGFQPLSGRALMVRVPFGQHLGLDLRWPAGRGGRQDEPVTLHLRYYLRLARDWATWPSTGKLPGFGGTYGRAGWGGRRWDGQAGWSARGAYVVAERRHPAAGHVALASYVYHRDSPSNYGEIMGWGGGKGAALLKPQRWYCVEQAITLNRPGADDGSLSAWVDGVAVFHRQGIRFRDDERLRIENAWMNVYVGGRAPALDDMHLFIDDVAVSDRYIGPRLP